MFFYCTALFYFYQSLTLDVPYLPYEQSSDVLQIYVTEMV